MIRLTLFLSITTLFIQENTFFFARGSDNIASCENNLTGTEPESDHCSAKKNKRALPGPEKLFDESTRTIEDAESKIQKKKQEFINDPNDPIKALVFADYLREYSEVIMSQKIGTDEGTVISRSAIEQYTRAIAILQKERIKNTHVTDDDYKFDIYSSPYEEMSVDAMICVAHAMKGSLFMNINMFENSLDSLEKALKYYDHLGAWSGVGYVSLILNDYPKAYRAYLRMLENFAVLLDPNNKGDFVLSESSELAKKEKDAVTGVIRVLMADESIGEWDWIKNYIVQRLPFLVKELEHLKKDVSLVSASPPASKMSQKLGAFHLALFHYYDKNTNDTSTAFHHIEQYSRYHMSGIDPYDPSILTNALEKAKTEFTFVKPLIEGMGVKRRTPIFIIGYPRSGSSLLERFLNQHPDCVGTGEDSIFSKHLNSIVRGLPKVLQKSMDTNSNDELRTYMKNSGLLIIKKMFDRYVSIASSNEKKPRRIVDKFLGNHKVVGMIDALFPNALILHIMRDPMDCVFSAYRQEFPHGMLDYTTDFTSLAHMYRIYRDYIDFWEQVLPGRITHIRYEDIVNDPEGISRALIEATGLPWDDDVLSNEKKYIINTSSSTQINKDIYSHHLKGWKKYEKNLQPLVELLDDRVELNYQTTLPGYSYDVA